MVASNEGAEGQSQSEENQEEKEEERTVQEAYDAAYDAALAALQAEPSAQRTHPLTQHLLQNNRHHVQLPLVPNVHGADAGARAQAAHARQVAGARNQAAANAPRVRVIRIDLKLLLKVALIAALLAQNGSWVHRGIVFTGAAALYLLHTGTLPHAHRLHSALRSAWHFTVSRLHQSATAAHNGRIVNEIECFVLGLLLSLLPSFRTPSPFEAAEEQHHEHAHYHHHRNNHEGGE